MSFSIWSEIAEANSSEREAEADRKRAKEEASEKPNTEVDWEREDPTQWE